MPCFRAPLKGIPRKRRIMPEPTAPLSSAPRSVVVVRALSGIGDLLCAVPALRSLRAGLPDARITLLGLPAAREIVERFPGYVDELVLLPGFPGLPEVPADIEALPGFLGEMQGRGFDLALQLHGSGLATNPLTELLGAKETAGFYLPGFYRPGELSVPYPARVHEVRRLLAPVRALGMPDTGEDLEWPVTEDDRAALERGLRDAGAPKLGAYAVLHPGAEDARRRWPVERFAEVAGLLASRGLTVVLTGTEAEMSVTRALARATNADVVDLGGRTSLEALGALIEGARLLVTNDTGPSHLADALRVPSVVIFAGASDPVRWAPLDTALHIAVAPERRTPDDVDEHCLRDGCRHLGWAEHADPDSAFPSATDVLTAVETLLAKEVADVA
jgi:ADP-heptose:LPS heptosyltransferase